MENYFIVFVYKDTAANIQRHNIYLPGAAAAAAGMTEDAAFLLQANSRLDFNHHFFCYTNTHTR